MTLFEGPMLNKTNLKRKWNNVLNEKKTRMKIFIKANLNKSDNHTNIDKYRVAANIKIKSN